MSGMDDRFSALARLYGADGLRRLEQGHVCVVGIGGVGSCAVEALARSGIGALTLVDLDEVCVSNVNRQIHALDGTVGQSKVDVMAERVRGINPGCRVTVVQEFFTAANAERLLDRLSHRPGSVHVVDAIDGVSNKTLLIALCRQRGIPILISGGAAGRREPTSVRVGDLANVTHDRLLFEVRRRLRRDHGWPRAGRKMGVDCVYSPETLVFPQSDGSVCATRPPATAGEPMRLTCDWGLGTATFVTGTFGFVAAGYVVRRIAEGKDDPPA